MTTQIHPSTSLRPPGSRQAVRIDDEMVNLVQAVWSLGFQTITCCQDVGEATEGERDQAPPGEPTGNAAFIGYFRGWSLLKMPRSDALAFLTRVAESETFRERVTIRWGPGSWRIQAPVVHTKSGFTLSPDILIHFPRDQVAELTRTVEGPL